jgi:hypothetical protein
MSAFNTVQAVHDYHRREWKTVPIVKGEKGPTFQGWPDFVADPADFPNLYGNANVGLILGHRSGDVADIDLDCTEAIELAPIYLPATASVFGRPSKPRSHWLYISPGAIKETFPDPICEDRKNTLLELRSDGASGGGHQTLMPPSIADGEQRQWDCDGDPAAVNPRVLRHRCALLAAACLVRRYISPYASERADSGHLELLWEFDHELARPAFGWFKRSPPDQPLRYPRPRCHQAPEDLDLAEVVAQIPNRFDWEGWNNIGLAIFAASKNAGDGFIAFDDFSARSSKYDPRETEARWKHYGRSPPNRTGIGKLARLAYEAGWRPARRAPL